MFSFSWTSGLLLIITLFLKLFLILFFIYTFRAVWLIKIWNRIRIFRAGLSKHSLIITDNLEISYLERKETKNENALVFVHGFGGDKLMFCDVVRSLSRKFHIVVIDLPGHGESKPDDDKSDYTITSQVESLHKFIRAFDFNGRKPALIGTSMGGHISGVYAAKYGETLSSVVLVCPGGIDGEEVTPFIETSREKLKNNHKSNALLPQTIDEFIAMLNLAIYHKVNIPRNIVGGFLEMKLDKKITHQKVFDDLTGSHEEYHSLDNSLENIKVPLLCVWGKHDAILHVSGSEVIKQKVQNAEVHLIERCGHAILLDRPGMFLKILLKFLENKSN